MRGEAAAINSLELNELHRIYTDVCNELGIAASDEWHRDEVAAIVMDLVRDGEREAGAIHQQVVLKLTSR